MFINVLLEQPPLVLFLVFPPHAEPAAEIYSHSAIRAAVRSNTHVGDLVWLVLDGVEVF